MDRFRIVGGQPLSGTVEISSAKNAVLPIMAAALMAREPVVIERCPQLTDVSNMGLILNALHCRVTQRSGQWTVDASEATLDRMPEAFSKRLRSSIFLMGPMLARFRYARVTYPGGCEIGRRPIDLHIAGLKALGARVMEVHGEIEVDGTHLHGAPVVLDFPSVGATENLMMAAAMAPGHTVITNAAREPEIVDLQRFINRMGGNITGGGTGRITIEGVSALRGVTYTPIPDRIQAGTLLVAAAITGGDVTVTRAHAGDMEAVLGKLKATGACIEQKDDQVRLCVRRRLKAVNASTLPYPGFPTDMQAQMMALLSVCEGTGVLVENIFENRFSHAMELARMGADILISGRTAVVRGRTLTGARVTARDLRGGAALVLAGLAAEGVTEVEDIGYIDRGYDALETTLTRLGASVVRLSEP